MKCVSVYMYVCVCVCVCARAYTHKYNIARITVIYLAISVSGIGFVCLESQTYIQALAHLFPRRLLIA